MATYFTSDWHYNHFTTPERGVIQFCGRPWPARPGTPEMNKALTAGLKSTLTEDDLLYVLGDCWFRTDEAEAIAILNSIPCTKILIRGNHDKWSNTKMKRVGFDDVRDHHIITTEGDLPNILMVHDPVVACMSDFQDHVILCGHVHQLWRTFGRCINVGVDVWDFKPVSLETLMPLIMEAKEQDWQEYHDNSQRKNYRSGSRTGNPDSKD